MEYKLEICANSIGSALAAQRGGADRIELCDNISEGGTTPSFGMIQVSKKLLRIPVFPIIRPRGGDFVYTEEEFEVMKSDVLMCKEQECEGVVFGILKKNGRIDKKRCAHLIALAKPMEVTFHRAFDCCNDLEKGLEDIISLGCRRVLTSGGKVFAVDGLSIIERLVKQAGDRIVIMPGSGINEENLKIIAGRSRASEFHTTAKSVSGSGENEILTTIFYQTNQNIVNSLKNILKSQL